MRLKCRSCNIAILASPRMFEVYLNLQGVSIKHQCRKFTLPQTNGVLLKPGSTAAATSLPHPDYGAGLALREKARATQGISLF